MGHIFVAITIQYGYISPMSKDPKAVVVEIISLIGKTEAERLLIEMKISPSMAAKLVRGKYKSELKALSASAIRAALQRASSQAS